MLGFSIAACGQKASAAPFPVKAVNWKSKPRLQKKSSL